MSNVIHLHCVSAIPLNPQGKILLQQRDDRPTLMYPGCWTTFGGSVEEGETLDEALRRELLEEIELDLPMKFWKVDDHHLERNGQKMVITRHIYVGRIDRAASALKLNEGQALGYFGLEDLHNLKIGFDFERVFREFFAILADGTLSLD